MAVDLRDLVVPVIGAPMAGGPTTPELAAAVSNAGGLGFLAAGYLSAQRFGADIAAARALTSGPVGVNLFVPQSSVAVAGELSCYAEKLTALALRLGVEVGPARFDDDDWDAKLDVVVDAAPEVASFTFGCPDKVTIDRLHAAGVTTVVTVTTVAEAGIAVAAGCRALVVQGPDAGGHRGTFSPSARPAGETLEMLLRAVLDAHDVPVVAAGGLTSASQVRGILDRGAVAAQVGTGLLLADEAGTRPAHRAALRDSRFAETVVTAAFSGRYARGIHNAFINEFDADAPLGYPEVHYMTAPLRAAAHTSGDSQSVNLWAGTQYRLARVGAAADIVAELAG
ncbi:nitronate monooxygenase [soil metagenome]